MTNETFITKIKVGDKFIRLTVLGLFRGEDGRCMAQCECECGQLKDIRASFIASGRAKSCGCLHREFLAMKGDATRTHGLSRSRTYECWCHMKQRCFYEKGSRFSRYGGRGISVCPKWMEFEGFFEDMGECPEGMSIDRINNDGNYEKSNCRWATRTQQARNRRSSKIVKFNGEAMTMAELAERTGISYKTIGDRIRRLGWTVDKAAKTPPRSKRFAARN